MFEEALRDRSVDRIHAQRQVRRQHEGRVPPRRVMSIGDRASAGSVLWSPLICAAWALRELPFKPEEILQVVVAPSRRRGGPCTFQAAADRVDALAAAELVVPTETLLFNVCALRLGTN